jgi:DNA-binding MarR family transcriptional regulator
MGVYGRTPGVSRAAGERDEGLHELRLAGRKLSTATIMFHQAVADRLGLNLTDHKCVDLLLLNGPLTAGELARMTALTTGAITAALDRLEKAGFVKRQDDPEDRRRVVVRVVPQRLSAMSKLFDSFSARLDTVAAGYTAQELALVVDFLTRTCAALQESAEELRQQATSARRQARGKAGDGGGRRSD